MEAVGWLERLGRGEISSVIRRNLEVRLTPVEIERRLIKYGDFTKLNNRINNEISETTNQIMIDNPQEREEYHRQYGDYENISLGIAIKRPAELREALKKINFDDLRKKISGGMLSFYCISAILNEGKKYDIKKLNVLLRSGYRIL